MPFSPWLDGIFIGRLMVIWMRRTCEGPDSDDAHPAAIRQGGRSGRLFVLFGAMQRNIGAPGCYTRRHAFPKSTCENPALVARLNEAARFHTV
ncbi:MAG: hypothetical protein GAK35_01602 [Herbaspirillum frisingense]|uniref:Uncharacterized protein n=1 Tax=Herbaspirillum frisingense TaxID=92645 RepID=A0A7V8FXQ2_9BURK|nr:MAG: hypothetical protein GAK35_01602 [Herbaspirillum frisingense]